jgi:hypothetical protein
MGKGKGGRGGGRGGCRTSIKPTQIVVFAEIWLESTPPFAHSNPDGIFKLLRDTGIDSKESNPPAM